MIYVGIDPGVSGGVAAVDEDGIMQLAQNMPETEKDLLMMLRVCAISGGAVALLERVSAGIFGKQGRMGVTSAFSFGRGYGKLEMALVAAEIPFDYIQPVKWQTLMGCLTKGDKNISKRRAQQLFPSVPRITHATADALLLAACCRRLRQTSNGQKEPAIPPEGPSRTRVGRARGEASASVKKEQ